MGRTASSWGKIGIFYLIYYICLAAFWAVLLAIFFQTVDDNRPTYTGSDSLLKNKPGLGYQPMPDYESTLIHFHSSYPASYKIYTDYLSAYMKQYKPENKVRDTIYKDCGTEKVKAGEDPTKTVCTFKEDHLGPCIAKQDYGYNEAQPCIALKLNKVYGWKPSNNSDIKISCAGMYPADKDNIKSVTYFPGPGNGQEGASVGTIKSEFFPFLSQLGYLSPLVMVKFEKIEVATLIMVKCTAEWQGEDERETADVRFELLMQTKTS